MTRRWTPSARLRRRRCGKQGKAMQILNMHLCFCDHAVNVCRDDALEARRVARENLMKIVDSGRQEQIAYRLAQLEQERKEDATFAIKFVEDAKAGMFYTFH